MCFQLSLSEMWFRFRDFTEVGRSGVVRGGEDAFVVLEDQTKNHAGNQLPAVLIGGKNLGLKKRPALALDTRPLRDLYFTLMNDVYALGVSDFGQNLTSAPPAKISELLSG